MKKHARDFVRNGVKEKLSRNELVLSVAVRLVRTVEVASIASAAGFDSLYIDLEHNSFSDDTAGQLCMAAMANGVTPFVRVPSREQIARVLDGGALGIIVPHVESAVDASQVVRAAKFPPLGDRSIAGNLPHFGFRSLPAVEVVDALNDATMVVVMIESATALERVDEIAAVKGVDIVFVGTNDLCASLGIPGQLDHWLVLEAYKRCAEACRKHGKHLGVGGLAGNPELTAELIRQGARYISTGTDLSFLVSAAAAKVKQMHQLRPNAIPTPTTKDQVMPKAYWICAYRAISDPARLAEYGKLAGPALTKGGARFLARGTPGKFYEAGLDQRTVLIEFDSVAQAVAAHDSPEYQEALRALGNGAERDVRIIEALA